MLARAHVAPPVPPASVGPILTPQSLILNVGKSILWMTPRAPCPGLNAGRPCTFVHLSSCEHPQPLLCSPRSSNPVILGRRPIPPFAVPQTVQALSTHAGLDHHSTRQLRKECTLGVQPDIHSMCLIVTGTRQCPVATGGHCFDSSGQPCLVLLTSHPLQGRP